MVQNKNNQATKRGYQAKQIRPIKIPHSPENVVLVSINLTVSRRNATGSQVELIALVGIQRVRGTSQILYKIFRDGEEIYQSPEWVESGENDIVTIKFIDTNVEAGSHTYTVTAENLTNGREAVVVDPTSFNGFVRVVADKNGHGEHDRNRSRRRNRNRDRSQNRDRDRNRSKSRDKDLHSDLDKEVARKVNKELERFIGFLDIL